MSKIVDRVRSETMLAYADCNDPRSFEITKNIRNLNFRASAAVSPKAAQDIMEAAIPNGYEQFSGIVAREVSEGC